MGVAILLEHTQGFKKALRQVSYLLNVSTKGVNFDPWKDVYQGQLVLLRAIPADSFSDDEPVETPAGAETTVEKADATVSGEITEANPAAPLTTDANVVHIVQASPKMFKYLNIEYFVFGLFSLTFDALYFVVQCISRPMLLNVECYSAFRIAFQAVLLGVCFRTFFHVKLMPSLASRLPVLKEKEQSNVD